MLVSAPNKRANATSPSQSIDGKGARGNPGNCLRVSIVQQFLHFISFAILCSAYCKANTKGRPDNIIIYCSNYNPISVPMQCAWADKSYLSQRD